MAETLEPAGSLSWARWGLFALSVLAFIPAGCTAMSQDVDAYYRQMAYNYKEAQEKAKTDAITLENETKVLATTGDFSNLKRTQRRLSRIKAWEEKCEKEAKRFEKAAEWTEAHFHLEEAEDSRQAARFRGSGRPVGLAGGRHQGPLSEMHRPRMGWPPSLSDRKYGSRIGDPCYDGGTAGRPVAPYLEESEVRQRPSHPCPAPST